MEKRQMLLVEGRDDKFVIFSILEKHKIKECFEVEDKEGFDNVIKSLPLLLKTDIDTIGIVVDADFDIKSRWESITKILVDKGYNTPVKIDEKGVIVESEEYPKIGVWLMPDNNKEGMLEDFVHTFIDSDDELFPYVEKSLEEIEKLGLNKYKDIHKSKAKIHTWLSWQETPGTPMGLAITKKYLTAESQLCMDFLGWIKKLFY